MEENPVYQGPHFLGFMDENYCRQLLRERKAKLVRKGAHRKIILNADTVLRIRLLNSGMPKAALSSIQVEECYSGCRKTGPITVTGKVRTLKKYRTDRGFVNWGENDLFPAKRWNPDNIKSPLYATSTRR